MSESEQRKAEEERANGSEWTEQDWPPFNSEEESGAKDADYYREHPEEVADFAAGLIDLRGGADKVSEGATWDNEQHTHVDANGVPRDWAHLTKFLKENPDQLDRFVDEYKNLEYFKKHPEELSKFVAELIRLRGEDSVNEGAWDNEQHTHVDETGAPRDWAHLTGYLKNNPDQLGRFVGEFMDLKEAEDATMAEAAEGGAEDEPMSEDEKMAERLRNDPEELARICELTNNGLDPEEVQYYKDNPDKIPQLVEKYNKMMKAEEEAVEDEAPVEEEPAEEKPAEEEPEAEADEEPEAEEEPEDEPEAIAAEGGGEEDDEEPEDEDEEDDEYMDYHPRFEGETDEMYKRRIEWEQMARENSEAYPRFRPMDKHAEGRYPEGANHKDYDEYLKNHPDGAMETDDEWLKRVGMPSLEEYLLNGSVSTDEAAEGGGRTRWSMMSTEEKKQLIKEHPRLPGEKTDEWAERLGIKELVPDTEVAEGGDEAEKELSREQLFEALGAEDAQEWIAAHYGYTVSELKKMSDEELRKLYDEFMGKGHKEAEKGKEGELSREQMLEALGTEDAMKWIDENFGPLTVAEIKAMSDEELAELYRLYAGRKETSKADDKEKEKDHEREKLYELLGVAEVQEWIGETYGYSVSDLKKMSNEELQKLYDEYLNRNKKAEKQEVDDPLVVARINREKDARAAAHDIAERMLSEKLDSKKGIKGLAQRVILGGMFREGTILRYEHRAYDMIRAKQNGENVEGLKDNDWAVKSGLERFVTAYVSGFEDEMIHNKAGESMDVYRVEKDKDGKEIVKHYWSEDGDRKTAIIESGSMYDATIQMRDAISKFAQTGDRKAFEQAIGDIQEELRGKGGDADALMAENYMAVAEAARARYEHGKGIDDVMAGFAFINGEARSNVRTEAHRDALDKITDRLSRSVVGRVLPPEVVGTAASLAVKFGRGNLRTALIAGGTAIVGAAMAPAVVPVAAGMATAGIFAAFRERSRVTGDRSTQARRLAQSESAGSRKYDERMKETQYTQHEAKKITDNLNEALASGDAESIKNALAIADTAVAMSDDRKIDLIRFSGGDTNVIERERIDMDVARAKARAELKRQGIKSAALAESVREAQELFEQDISAKDKAFRKLRRRRVAAQSMKSAAISGVMSVVTQELTSLVRDDQVGMLEHAGLKLRENRADASNTFLAAVFVPRTAERFTDIVSQTGQELTQDQIDGLRAKGYSVTQGVPKVVETEKEVSMGAYMEANENAHMAGYLGNGTRGADGNELKGVYNANHDEHRGPWMRLKGKSWGSGVSFETKDLQPENVGFVVTIDGKKMLFPAVAGDKVGVYYPDYSKMDPAMETIFRERLFDRVQGVYMPGTETDGVPDCYSIWGYGGSGKVPETMTTTVREVTQTWDITSTTERIEELERDATGFVTFGATSRKNLTLGRRAQTEKPESTEGRPGTHVEETGGDHVTPTDDIVNAGGGPEAVPPAPAPVAAEEAPVEEAPVEETPVEEPKPEEAAPAPSAEEPAPEGTKTEESVSDPNKEIVYEKFAGPVTPESASYDLAVDDDQIREAAAVRGRFDLSGIEMDEVRRAVTRWNGLSDEYRKGLLDGQTYEYSPMVGPDREGEFYGGSYNAELDRKAFEKLHEYGLIRLEANDNDFMFGTKEAGKMRRAMGANGKYF